MTVAYERTPKSYKPFWLHSDIWGKYRIEFQKRFVARGFRFNPMTMRDDVFGVFVEPLGSYFIVFQNEEPQFGRSLGRLWEVPGSPRPRSA